MSNVILAMRAGSAVCKRELMHYFFSPLSYVVAALFLIIHGYSFFLLCQILSTRAEPVAVVMSYFFGGTFLYWLFLIFLVSVLTMRLLAEEHAQGTLEALLSAPLPEWTIIVGKYVAALLFYVVLWVPTMVYPLLLSAYAGGQKVLDLGPLFCGYLGTLLIGISAIGVGLLCSTLARSLMLSSVLTFTCLSLLLLLGLLSDLYVKHETLREVLAYLHLFHHMDELARGIVDSRRVVYHLSLGLFALVCATRILKVRRGDFLGRLSLAAFVGIAALSLVGINYLAARMPRRSDFTALGIYSLSERLKGLLFDLPVPVQVTVFVPDDGGDRDDLHDRVRELMLRSREVNKERFSYELLDNNRDRERVRLLSERYKLREEDRHDGVVVVEARGRQKFISRADLAEMVTESTPQGPHQRIAVFRGEAALYSALLTALEDKTPEVCFPRGHGEPEHESLVGHGLSELSEALRRNNFSLRGLDGLGEVPSTCDVLALVGPERPLLASEVSAITRFLQKDKGGLFLLGPMLDRGVTKYLSSGLEGFLKERGIELQEGVVVDLAHRVEGSLSFVIDEGYGDHPVSGPLMHKRTLWSLSRPLQVDRELATVLVSTGEDGFVETSLASLRDGKPVYNEGEDRKGPVTLAAVSGRVAVFGSAQIATNDGMALFNKDLLLSAVEYVAKVERKVILEDKRQDSMRLVLSEDQSLRVMLVTLLGMPFMAILLGIGLLWIRRA